MKCPRRLESFQHDNGAEDEWKSRDGYHACSFCGSMHPDDFFKAIERDQRMITGTDKNYKVYVEIVHPQAGKIVEIGSESGPAFNREGKPNKPDLTAAERDSGRYDRKIHGTAPPTKNAKFYYQHLDEAGQDRFIHLNNSGDLNIEPRFGLYRAPFFATPTKKDAK
ncbi:MAG: hypothetical protein ACHQWH_03035 [Nitrososphaerales archaeon]